MDPIIGGAVISGVGSLLGGLFGSSSNEEINEKNLQFAREQMVKNEALQREFAQSGLQWKIEDARKAGIHPLAALGANTISYSPQVIGSGMSPDTNMSQAVSSFGQDIGRAVAASETDHQRAIKKLQLASLEQDVIGKQLQNSILHQQSFVGPPMPSAVEDRALPGQGNVPSKLVQNVPLTVTGRDPGAPHREHGNVPDLGWARTKTGMAPVPSKDVKERIEDSLIQETLWAVRNNLLPSIGYGSPPPREHLKEFGDYDRWKYNLGLQEYQPTYNWADRYWKKRGHYAPQKESSPNWADRYWKIRKSYERR